MLKKPVEMEISGIKIDDSVLIRGIDDAHVSELEKNIREVGQINPVIVEEYKDGLFHVVAHAHEFKALQNIARSQIKAKPNHRAMIITSRFEGDEIARKKVQLTENILRKPMEMKEVGAIVSELVKKTKKTQREIAKELGWSESYISECVGTFNGKIKNREAKTSTVEVSETETDTEKSEFKTFDDDEREEPIDEHEKEDVPLNLKGASPDEQKEDIDEETDSEPPKQSKNHKDIQKIVDKEVEGVTTNSQAKKILNKMIEDSMILEQSKIVLDVHQYAGQKERVTILIKKLYNFLSLLEDNLKS